jgi:hypothetical protein
MGSPPAAPPSDSAPRPSPHRRAHRRAPPDRGGRRAPFRRAARRTTSASGPAPPRAARSRARLRRGQPAPRPSVRVGKSAASPGRPGAGPRPALVRARVRHHGAPRRRRRFRSDGRVTGRGQPASGPVAHGRARPGRRRDRGGGTRPRPSHSGGAGSPCRTADGRRGARDRARGTAQQPAIVDAGGGGHLPVALLRARPRVGHRQLPRHRSRQRRLPGGATDPQPAAEPAR